MCSGADHAVIKRKPKAVHGRKVRVNDLCSRCICFAECCKQTLCLRLQIVPRADRDQTAASKRVGLLVVAKDGAGTLFLLCLQISQHVLRRRPEE